MNRYNIEGVIGEGAYGVVLKCTRKDNGRVVAIKKFKAPIEDGEGQSSTLREFQVLKRVKHKNIMRLLEAFKSRGRLYLVLEYCNGDALDLLKQQPEGQGLDLVTTLHLISGVLQGLAYLHGQGIIHRDIKLENILIGMNGDAKLGDFGFARPTTKDVPMTSYVATRWYRAPELLVGGNYTTAVDVWATGCVAAELLSGQPLLPGQTETDQLLLIAKMCGGLCRAHALRLLTDCRYAGTRVSCLSNSDDCEANVYASIRPMFRGAYEQLRTSEEKAKINALIKLIAKMLNCDITKRPTCIECLKIGVENNLWTSEGIKELEYGTVSPQTPIYQQVNSKNMQQINAEESGPEHLDNQRSNSTKSTRGNSNVETKGTQFAQQKDTGHLEHSRAQQYYAGEDRVTNVGTSETKRRQQTIYTRNVYNISNQSINPDEGIDITVCHDCVGNNNTETLQKQKRKKISRKNFNGKVSILNQQQQQPQQQQQNSEVFYDNPSGIKNHKGDTRTKSRSPNTGSQFNRNDTISGDKYQPSGQYVYMQQKKNERECKINNNNNLEGGNNMVTDCLTVNYTNSKNSGNGRRRVNPNVKERDGIQTRLNNSVSQHYTNLTPPKRQTRQEKRDERDVNGKRSSSYGTMLNRKFGADFDSLLDIAQYAPRRRM